MKRCLQCAWLVIIGAMALPLYAAEAQPLSNQGAIFKMLLGLALVLLVMFALTVAAKRLMPNRLTANAAVKVVGGVNVGPKERVVVVEVADRWLVVGVGGGQVNALSEMDAQSTDLAELVAKENPNAATPRFKEWLTKAMRS